jgi:hypothetical protein
MCMLPHARVFSCRLLNMCKFDSFTNQPKGIGTLLIRGQYGRVSVRAPEPAIGDEVVRRLGEMDAIRAHVCRWVAADACARHAADRGNVEVVLSAAGAATSTHDTVRPVEPIPVGGHREVRHGRVEVGVDDPYAGVLAAEPRQGPPELLVVILGQQVQVLETPGLRFNLSSGLVCKDYYEHWRAPQRRHPSHDHGLAAFVDEFLDTTNQLMI